MSPLSRRDFLKTTAMSFALLAGSGLILDPLRRAWAENPAALNELLVLCHSPDLLNADPTGIAATNPGFVKILEASSGKSYGIDIPFYGHTVAQNPRYPHQLVTFEKWGLRGALVDLKEKTILASAKPTDGNVFFGHAVYISGGSVLVNSEDSYGRDAGHLFLRDPASLKIIQKYPTFGDRPHECRLADNDKTVMVVHEGKPESPSNITWIDMSSGKVLHKIMLDVMPGANFTHLDVSYDGWICTCGGTTRTPQSPIRTLIAFVSPDGKIMRPNIPADIYAHMIGEGLSIAFLGKSGLVAVTLQKSNMVAVFDYKTQEYLGSAPILKASGVLPDLAVKADGERSMIVSHGKNLIRVKLTPGSNLLDQTIFDKTFGGNGAHLARIYV